LRLVSCVFFSEPSLEIGLDDDCSYVCEVLR